jgi:hypothetical protein
MAARIRKTLLNVSSKPSLGILSIISIQFSRSLSLSGFLGSLGNSYVLVELFKYLYESN